MQHLSRSWELSISYVSPKDKFDFETIGLINRISLDGNVLSIITNTLGNLRSPVSGVNFDLNLVSASISPSFSNEFVGN